MEFRIDRLPWQQYNARCENQRIQFVNVKQTDKPAELRVGDDRTATFGAAHLCWSIWIFCAQSTESRCVVITKETENMLERTGELIRGMKVAESELTFAIQSFRGASLAAVNMMLAGGELFDTDFEETNGGDIDKAIAELGLDKRAAEYFRISVEQVENSIASFKPTFQHKLLQVVMGRQSQRDALAAEENRRQEATGGLHETIDAWPTEKVESLSRLLASEEFTKKLHLQVA
jgi:hypothetical protein